MTPGAPMFTVRGVGRFPGQLERLIALAEDRGLRSLLLDILREITESLQTRPREWGDPYTNYRGLHAVGYGRSILPAGLRVQYAVHDTEPVVWLSSIRVLPESPFA